MNPYQSPEAECGADFANESEQAPRARWLVTVSLLLAIFCEMPGGIEGDMLYIVSRLQNAWLFLLIKVAFSTIILLPMFVYIGINGWRALKAVRGRVCAIVVIVSLVLLLYTPIIVGMLWR